MNQIEATARESLGAFYAAMALTVRTGADLVQSPNPETVAAAYAALVATQSAIDRLYETLDLRRAPMPAPDMAALTRAALKASADLSEAIAVEAERRQPGSAARMEAAISAGGRLVLAVETAPSPRIDLNLITRDAVHSVGSIPLSMPPMH
jgi:hypothetical protein